MNAMAEWFTGNLVGIAGIAGFILSLALAISQSMANRLKIKAEDCILIDAHEVRDSVFLYVCLYNQTNIPFSLIDIQIDAGRSYKNVLVERTVRTYFFKGDPVEKAPVGPVVLSPAFPMRFDSYAADVLLLEVLRQNIDTKLLHPDCHDQAGLLRRRYLPFRRLCKRLFPIRLMIRTSRGAISIPVRVDSVQGWDWLETYAVHKAGNEGKISFPM